MNEDSLKERWVNRAKNNKNHQHEYCLCRECLEIELRLRLCHQFLNVTIMLEWNRVGERERTQKKSFKKALIRAMSIRHNHKRQFKAKCLLVDIFTLTFHR
ncbi:CLUMA_CG016857, isoform A [Clunio marinus]|uniref:CLUMA_CG016857, isoform A n=1 Tax=Clunio marinus TaxID=568069 RepID=A0A1J1IUK7_9DIPT|nr:CLUMA_CG016857, isoform A [Clunio marinus]